ncbi:putative glycosyl transferase, family 2 protein 2 [Thermococcus cleftensis]|uniref:Glycosyl transferase, family 2 protein 2 n=1 Tax=Thermococcus cleftensis (strain DSM 27260 / KACC 17922 / CL1) TaxID=163003 RepID=I3ZU14_THECF|nr:glycosyltransferase family A protein [Thermococcus cleftensis]AFL95198.1 putative glycosyl transferase, family 2 protein 2 [Thermococcus cleftensis]
MRPRSSKTRGYLLVTPAKNEEANLPLLAKSVVNQSIRPRLWVIVNDNSSDGTGKIAEELAERHRWIEVLHLKGGGGYDLKYRYSQVVRIGFERALSLAIGRGIPFGYIGVLDADFILERRFFEKLVEAFGRDPRLGIVSGGGYYLKGGRLVWEGTDPERPKGSPRLFRRECFREVGGYREGPSPDTVSHYLARFLGWRTGQVVDAIAVQLRETEGRFGHLRGYEMLGWSNYKLGASFTSILARAGFLMLQNPVKGYALVAGYLKAFKGRERRIENGDLREMIRSDLTLGSNLRKLRRIRDARKLVPVRESDVRG